jgi:hypothetical protein
MFSLEQHKIVGLRIKYPATALDVDVDPCFLFQWPFNRGVAKDLLYPWIGPDKLSLMVIPEDAAILV